MNKLRHGAATMVILVILISLYMNIYEGVQQGYNFTIQDRKEVTISGETKYSNIMEALRDMRILRGLNDLIEGVRNLNPSGGFTDILGGLATSGLGVLQTVIGFVTLPFDVIYIITTYYSNAVIGSIAAIAAQAIAVYVAFLLLSAYLRHDV